MPLAPVRRRIRKVTDMNPKRQTGRSVAGWLAVCAGFVWLAGGAAFAGDVARGGDPFAPENKGKLPRPATADRIDFKVSVTPQEARRGETVKLTITGIPKPGFHTYPMTQRSADKSESGLPVQFESQLSRISFGKSSSFQPLWPIKESPPEWTADPRTGGVYLEYDKEFTWSQDLLVKPDASPGPKWLYFQIAVNVCNADSCKEGKHWFEVPMTVSDAEPVPLSQALQDRVKEAPPAIQAVQPPSNLVAEARAGKATQPQAPPEEADFGTPLRKDSSIWGLLAAASLSALLMLCTPCVFPMIPITVTFFLKRSEQKHHNALMTAGVYSLTIIIVLATAVLVLGKLVTDWANSTWMNLGLGLVLIFFALSLFGMYEIELPSALARFTSAREGQGGYLGAFFMALTFTITSFTCTGPFLGPLLVAAKEMHLSSGKLILAAVAYSATFAAPFFVLALFPSLLKALPRSGNWLNSVKVVTGFLELGASLKFLAIADQTLHPGNPWFFNYDTVLCAWIALSVACGMYLFGVFRLPHDAPAGSIGVGRMVLGSLFFGLAVYMTPALWRETPLGVIGQGLVSFLPQDNRPVSAAADGKGGQAHLTWHRDYRQAWEQARREGKLLFIDFTGVNCPNCIGNERTVFPIPAVRQELEKYVRVQLYTDSVPDASLSADEAREQAELNKELQAQTFGDITLPLYAILKPDGKTPTQEGKLVGTKLGHTGGTIRDSQEFLRFLKNPQKTQMVQTAELGD
jgi:thiol:disulfide interchange protein